MSEIRSLKMEIISSYVALAMVALVITIWVLTLSYSENYNETIERELRSQATLLEYFVKDKIKLEYQEEVNRLLQNLTARIPSRITIILPNGTILADSQEDARKIGSLALRPEVQKALTGQIAVEIRRSIISDAKMVFIAYPVLDNTQVNGIIRIASPAADPVIVMLHNRPEILLLITSIFLMGLITGLVMNRSITKPLYRIKNHIDNMTEGNFQDKIPSFHVEEFDQITNSINYVLWKQKNQINILSQDLEELEVGPANMTEAVIVIDSREHIITINTAAERLFNISVDHVKGRTVQEAIRNTDFQKFVTRTFAEKIPVEGDIIFLGDPDKFLQAHGAPLKNSDGTAIGALIVLNDVSRLKALEIIRRDFVANVSHELRTPVTSIKGFLETLKEGAIKDPVDAERFLDIILKHTDRLNSIIEDLLSLSRIESNVEKGEIHLQLDDVNDVVTTVIKACSRKASIRNIEIDTKIEPGLSAYINKPLLEQAVENLLDNAIKYSDSRSKIEITTFTAGNDIGIRVKDYGCGIPKEHLSRIFERFYRVDKARSRTVGGTGLGLAIARHIVTAHRGRINVESSANQGSSFTIFIPKS